MQKDRKQLLIVDDSEIDREILKSVLYDDFDIIEAENGYAALELIMKKKDHIDGMLLDVSMPVLDGFSVLQFLKENHIDTIPIFLITAEATKDNVEKAVHYNVSEFISKPFDRENIIKRLKSKLGVIARRKLSQDDISETKQYIEQLEELYNKYLAGSFEDNEHYLHVSALVKIMLKKYVFLESRTDYSDAEIEMISKAAYFYDIGNMLMPNSTKFRALKADEAGGDPALSHTLMGSGLIRLNFSRQCEYFVQICADMCEHHHERYDGTGYPHRIVGDNLSIYTQMCRIADEFDSLFMKYHDHNDIQIEFVFNELMQDKGSVSEWVFSLLRECKYNILLYYKD